MSKMNTALALCNAFIRQIFQPKNKGIDNNVDVIVLASEAIGDNLIFLDVLHFIEEHNTSEGVNTVFICNKKMESFWLENKKLKTTMLISVDKNFSGETTSNIARVKKMRIGRVILPMHHTLSVIVANCLKSNTFYAMLYNEWLVNRQLYIKKLYNIGKKHILYIQDGYFIGSAYEKLVNEIYGEKYSWGLPRINFNIKPIAYSNYIFFAPFSNLAERSLSEEQMLEIIRYLISESNYKVILSGTKNDQKEASIISENIGEERLINLVGKTSFDEYLNLIANAHLVIGTDSGSIHYAASLGVRSVVLAGLWSGAFLPYENNRFNVFPKCIYTREKMNCNYCLNRHGGIQKGNNDCYENTINGNRRLCLENIDIEDVKLMISENL